MISESSYVHFISGSGSRLIPVAEVVEIIPMVLLDESGTADAPSGLRGLFNYRGKIIPVFDVYADGTKTPLGIEHFLIVTTADGRSLALVATEVNQLVSVPASDISAITPLGEKSFLVAKVNDLMIRIVNTINFLETAAA